MTLRRISRRVSLAGGAAILASGLTLAGSHSALALYSSDCSPANFGSPVVYTTQTGPAHAYAGSGGRTGAATVAAGVCLDNTPFPVAPPPQVYTGSTFGSDVEAGASPTNGVVNGPSGAITGVPGAYAIAQASDSNGSVPVPGPGIDNWVEPGDVGLVGYAGVSNFETGSYAPGASVPWSGTCNAGWNGGGSNAGGGVMLMELCVTWRSTVGAYGLPQAWSTGLPLPIACGSQASGTDWDNTYRDGCYLP
jgi:hypothetical protein